MAIVLDASSSAGLLNLGTNGTISNLAVGGVPNGVIDGDAIATGAITASKFSSGVGGKILQVVSTAKTDTMSHTGTTAYTDVTGLSVNITPSSSSNKILVMLFLTVGQGNVLGTRIVRDSTAIGIGDASGSRLRCTALIRRSGDNNTSGTGTPVFLDSPSTTSQITYKAQISLEGSGHTAYINRTPNDLDSLTGSRCMSSITVMEVSA